MGIIWPYTTGAITLLDADDVNGVNGYPPAHGSYVAPWKNKGTGGDAVQVSSGGPFTNPKFIRNEFGDGLHGVMWDGNLDVLQLTNSALDYTSNATTSWARITNKQPWDLWIAVRDDCITGSGHPATRYLIGNSSDSSQPGFVFFVNSSRQLGVIIVGASASLLFYTFTSVIVPLGKLCLIRISCDGDKVSAQINGGSTFQSTSMSGIGSVTMTNEVRLGAALLAGSLVGVSQCVMGKLAFFNAVLTTTPAADTYAAIKTAYGADWT